MIRQENDKNVLNEIRQSFSNDNYGYKFAFAMIKPDGSKYITTVMDMIEDKINPYEMYFFLTDKWKEIATELYDAHNEWTPNYFATFSGYSNTLVELFGNFSIVILMKIEKSQFEDSIKKLVALKKEVRSFRDGSFAFVTNATKLKEFQDIDLPKTILKIVYEGLSEKEVFYLDPVGFHDVQAFNIIHTPDASPEGIKRELSILEKYNVFDKDNEIDLLNYELLVLASQSHSMAVLDYLRRKNDDNA